MALNKVLLIGNVGKDPEIRNLESGASVATITLATSERYKDRNGETKELTEWHTIVAWRQLADLAKNYIRKGSQIYVEGRIRSRSWDDQSGVKHYVTEILADSIQLLGRRQDNNSIPQGGAYTPPAQPVQQPQYQAPAPAPTPNVQMHVGVTPTPVQTTPIVSPADLNDDGSDDLPF